MGCTNTVATRITTTNHEHVFALGGDALFFREFHACQHTVLLGEQFEGEVYAFEFAARGLQIAGGRRACGDDVGIVGYPRITYIS